MNILVEHDLYFLIAWTVLNQLAYGAFYLLFVNDWRLRDNWESSAYFLTRKAAFWLIPIPLLGFLFSLFHTGAPLEFFRAALNPMNSWFSREKWIWGLFVLFLMVYAYFWYKDYRETSYRRAAATGAALLAFPALIAGAWLYVFEAQPAWNNYATFLTYTATALLLGPLFLNTLFIILANKDEKLTVTIDFLKSQRKILAYLLLGSAIFYLITLGLRLNLLAHSLDPIHNKAYGLIMGKYKPFFMINIFFSLLFPFITAALLKLMSDRNQPLELSNRLIVGTFIMAFIGELSGRALFLLASVHMNIGY